MLHLIQIINCSQSQSVANNSKRPMDQWLAFFIRQLSWVSSVPTPKATWVSWPVNTCVLIYPFSRVQSVSNTRVISKLVDVATHSHQSELPGSKNRKSLRFCWEGEGNCRPRNAEHTVGNLGDLNLNLHKQLQNFVLSQQQSQFQETTEPIFPF